MARTSPVTAAAIGAQVIELGGMSRISPARLSNTRRPPPSSRQAATCWASLPYKELPISLARRSISEPFGNLSRSCLMTAANSAKGLTSDRQGTNTPCSTSISAPWSKATASSKPVHQLTPCIGKTSPYCPARTGSDGNLVPGGKRNRARAKPEPIADPDHGVDVAHGGGVAPRRLPDVRQRRRVGPAEVDVVDRRRAACSRRENASFRPPWKHSAKVVRWTPSSGAITLRRTAR